MGAAEIMGEPPVIDPPAQEAEPVEGAGTSSKKPGSREPMVVIEPLDVKSFTEETRRRQSSAKSGPVVQLEDLNVLLGETMNSLPVNVDSFLTTHPV